MKRLHSSTAVVILAFALVASLATDGRTASREYLEDLAERVKLITGGPHDDSSPDFHKCGTPIATEWWMHREELAPYLGYAAGANQDSVRPDLEFSIVSPGGYFRVHFDTSGNHKATEDFGVDAQGFPTYIDTVAMILDSCWEFEIDVLGYQKPPIDSWYAEGGDSLYDVYIVELGHLFLGLTNPDRLWESNPHPSGVVPATSFIELSNDYSQVEGYQSRPLFALRVTVAHEFFHSIQFGYDPKEFEFVVSDNPNTYKLWWQEMTATWMEEQMYDDLNDYISFLTAFYDHPWTSLREFAPASSHPYASVVWPIFLTEKYGQNLMREFWEDATRFDGFNVFRTWEDALNARGSDIKDAFSEFLMWNYFSGPRYDPDLDFYPDGNFLSYGVPDKFVVGYSTYPIEESSPPAGAAFPDEMGSSYILLEVVPFDSTDDLGLRVTPRNEGGFLVTTVGIVDNKPVSGERQYTTNIFDPVVVSDWTRFDRVLAIFSPYTDPLHPILGDGSIPRTKVSFTYEVSDSSSLSGDEAAGVLTMYPNPLKIGAGYAGAEQRVLMKIRRGQQEAEAHIFSASGTLIAGGETDGMFIGAGGGPTIKDFEWFGTNRNGSYVASGVYLCVVRIGSETEIHKIAVISTGE